MHKDTREEKIKRLRRELNELEREKQHEEETRPSPVYALKRSDDPERPRFSRVAVLAGAEHA